MHIEEGYYQLSDTQLFVQRAGNAEQVLLLIHGFLGSTFSWRYLLPLLSPHFTVYAVDLPGFGRSDKGKDYPYTLAAYAKSIRAFIQSQAVRHLTIIAHSMGGQVAMRLATIVPRLVQRLILIAPSSYLPAAKRWQKTLFRLPLSHRVVPLLMTPDRAYRELTNVVYDEQAMDLQKMYDGYVTPLRDRHFPRSLFQFASNRESDLSREQLRQIGQPTLLLWGRHDRVVPLHVGQRLVRDLPKARMEVIEQTGHVPMEEKPRNVYDHITSFVTSTAAGTQNG